MRFSGQSVRDLFLQSGSSPSEVNLNGNHTQADDDNRSNNQSKRDPRESVVSTGRAARVTTANIASKKKCKVGEMIRLTTEEPIIICIWPRQAPVNALPFGLCFVVEAQTNPFGVLRLVWRCQANGQRGIKLSDRDAVTVNQIDIQDCSSNTLS